MTGEPTAEVFEEHRPMMFGVAYAMLGDTAAAEDAVQEAYLRWHERGPGGGEGAAAASVVLNPGGYLRTVVTRLSIDRLRSASHRRETYTGPWLPEPVVSGDDPCDRVVEAEGISMALLVALERLNPHERAALVLRDVFDLDYSEIAEVIDRTPTTTRQVTRRARERVGDPRRRRGPASPEDLAVRDRLLGALLARDVDAVRRLLADDVVSWSDGGAEVRAARRPVVGADRVTRFLLWTVERLADTDVELVSANGEPAMVASSSGVPVAATVFEVEDALVVGLRTQVNPSKLSSLARHRARRT